MNDLPTLIWFAVFNRAIALGMTATSAEIIADEAKLVASAGSQS